MQQTTALLSAVAALGFSQAAPLLVERQTAPAPSEVQANVLNLMADIVYMTNNIVNTDHPTAEYDFTEGESLFASLKNNITTAPCPEMSPPAITTAIQAIEALNCTQSDLSLLSTNLAIADSSPATLADGVCSAYSTFNATKNYIYDILSFPTNGASNEPVGAETNPQGYDPNKLQQTYLATEISLTALVASLRTIHAGQPASTYSKTAYYNAENTLNTYSKAAGTAAPHSCPPSDVMGAADAQEAIMNVQAVETQATDGYQVTMADDGQKIAVFCAIAADMAAANEYVKGASPQ